MTDYTAIRGTSMTLYNLLQAAITNSGLLDLATVPIDLRSPRELQDASVTSAVSLWLYRVTRDADLVNAPPQRISPTLVQPVGFPADLHYLITPISTDPSARQTLMGRVLQVLQDRSILRTADFTDSLAGERMELRVTFEPVSLDELARVWDALTAPYELSVSYRVQVLKIASDLNLQPSVRVTDLRERYTQIVSE